MRDREDGWEDRGTGGWGDRWGIGKRSGWDSWGTGGRGDGGTDGEQVKEAGDG